MTLVEVAVTLAIFGIVLPVVGGILWQFQTTPSRNSARLPIQQEMRVATTWIRLDANKAQSFEAGTGDTYGTFRWLDFSTFPATRYKVVYTWDEGTEVNPAATASPLNYGILHRQPSTDGVAEAKIPLIRHLAATTDATFTIDEEVHEANSESTKRVLTVNMTATIDAGADGTLQESTTLTAEHRPEQTDPLEHLYYFLHNNPTPPTGDTTSQTNLPLDLVAPTATTLFNYDTDRDSEPGIQLIRSSDPAETDDTKLQEWVSATLSSTTTIDARMSVFIAAAGKGFVEKDMVLLATVLDLDPGSGEKTKIGDRASESFASQSTWSLISVHFDKVTYTVSAGHKLVVMVQFAPESGDEGMVAYDTTSYVAFLMVPTQP